MGDNILEIKNLSKNFKDFSLNNLNLIIPRGVIMGLIGENGAGKSTTINCILNEIGKSTGEIYIFGKCIRPLSAAIRAAFSGQTGPY